MCLFNPVNEYRRDSDFQIGLALSLGALTLGSKARYVEAALSQTYISRMPRATTYLYYLLFTLILLVGKHPPICFV